MVSGPAKRRLASRPVRPSGEKLARSSRNTRTSSSQSMSSSAKVTRPSSCARSASSILPRSALAASTSAGLAKKAAGEPREPVRHRIGAEIGVAERDRCRRLVVAVAGADQHVGAVAGEGEFGERAGKARARLDQRHQRARGEIDALEHALPQMADFARQPVILVGVEELVVGEHLAAGSPEDLNTIAATSSSLSRMMQDRVVEFARELAAARTRRRAPPWRRPMRAAALAGPRSVMVASRAARSNSTESEPYSTPSAVKVRVSGVSLMPCAGAAAARLRGELPGARRDRLVELRARHHFVDQPPLDRALAFDAFLGGAEHVGMVAAHFALVGDAREPAGAGQHREQRQFRQRHRRRAVVDQHDVVGRERQLIAAAGRGAVDGADRCDAGILAQILDAVARLVGEFAEIDLVGVGRAGQHADIGAGARTPAACPSAAPRRAPADARSAAARSRRQARYRRRDRRN